MLIKLSTSSCLAITMQDAVTIYHNIKTDNSSLGRVEQLRYLETTLMNQNSIQEEIREQIEVRECLLSFGSESFVFQFAIQQFKD
jgi:hypothetical protein